MADRLEELLAMMDDEDEQEDVLALMDRTVPAAVSPEKDGDGEIAAVRDSEAERWDNPAGPDGGEADHAAGKSMDGGGGAPIPVHALTKRMEHSAGDGAGMDGSASIEAPKHFAGEIAGADGAVSAEESWSSAGETANETDGDDSTSQEETEGGLVWRLDGGVVQKAEAVWRRELADRQDEAVTEAVRRTVERTMGTAAERLSVEKGGELAQAVRHEAESGLEELYRQTVQASRPTVQTLPVEQAGRTLQAEEPGLSAALTVDELDRAVRRDSRRYDGGMMIY